MKFLFAKELENAKGVTRCEVVRIEREIGDFASEEMFNKIKNFLTEETDEKRHVFSNDAPTFGERVFVEVLYDESRDEITDSEYADVKTGLHEASGIIVEKIDDEFPYVMPYDEKYILNADSDELLKRLQAKTDDELKILFQILDSHANSFECYAWGHELNDGMGTNEYDDDEMYYGHFPNGELEFDIFTGVWDETGETGQYVIDDDKLLDIVEEFEAKTHRKQTFILDEE